MDSKELEAVLQLRNVPRGMYRIRGDANEAYCLVHEANDWLVYYSERGNRNDLRAHGSEDGACIDLLTRVLRELERNVAW